MKLIPPDLQRCQAEIKEGSFMTLGPRSFERCNNEPTWIAAEAPRSDGEPSGSMSLCDSCKDVCEKKLGSAVIFKEIDLVNEIIKLSNEIKQKEKETGKVPNLIPVRRCEKCNGPGPALWDDRDQRYFCRGCHSNPDDEFFASRSRAMQAVVELMFNPRAKDDTSAEVAEAAVSQPSSQQGESK